MRGPLIGIVCAALGVALLAGAAVSTVTAGRDAAVADLDHALAANSTYHATALREYFERAQSINLLLGHDVSLLLGPDFESRLLDPGRSQLSGTQAGVAAAAAGAAMAYLEQLYPGRISEADVIDATGTELGQVVSGKVLPASQMSTNEMGNPFFAPTMRLAQGQVYQSAPYVSEDSHEWVISNSTPLVSASGRTWGMVHFEVALDSFRDNGNQDSFTTLIVDNRTNEIVLDSRRPLVGRGSLGQAGSTQLGAFVARPGAAAAGTVDGRRMSVARVPVQVDNANSWSVVSAAPIGAAGWSRSVGPAPTMTALAALLLLGFAGAHLRASRRCQVEGRRRQIEARYRALIDQSSDLVLVVDRAGRADFLSPSAERLLASHEPDPVTSFDTASAPVDFTNVVDPPDRARFSAALHAAVPGFMSAGEFRITCRDGVSTFEMSVQDLTADPSVRGLVLTGHDVTDRLALQEEMEYQALHDTLTGLPNRALLADRFEQALEGAERDGTSAGLLLLDLDRFKEVNDTFGHQYGDELLRQIGLRLAGVLRGVDTIARLGGDEFAVVLPDLRTLDDATDVATTLLRALARPFNVEGVDLDVEASIGVVLSGRHGADSATLLLRADVAMYLAKTQHAGVFVYDPIADGHSVAKLGLFGDLRRALDRGELVLHYQPKVNISTGDLVDAEALVRWQHPEHGLVLPDAFIPLAESSGLIGPLTRYVLDTALTQARTWLDEGRPLPIAVNLSARNLNEADFTEMVAELLALHAIPAHLLELEVTESAIMIDPVRARQTLESLAALGVRLSLDDFGAGYTSLSQLTTMPFSEIKIDCSFVMAMAEEPRKREIVKSVISLGHNLGLTLVAEGVETAHALAALAGFGCDVAQGYHISRPMPVAGFNTWRTARDLISVPPLQVPEYPETVPAAS
ncbi:MAG: EAL domain-containing protein [Dermatophilaceae bacterium]